MQKLQGGFAEWYNIRKRRSGAFWDGRYHSTMIESGSHLWNCMAYIDLNMVRAGVVKHPREWRWNSHDEMLGERTRHTLINMPKMLELVGIGSREEFARSYERAIDESLSRGQLHREPHWTEAIAVGSEDYIRGIAAQLSNRTRLEMAAAADGVWRVQESDAPFASPASQDPQASYGDFSGLKIERKAGFWVLNWA